MQHLDEGLLQAWLDHPRSGLEPSEVVQIERHLVVCDACTRALETLRGQDEEAHALLAGGVDRAVPRPPFEEVVRRARGHDQVRRARRRLNRLAWAASLVVALGVGWWSNDLYRQARTYEVLEAPARLPEAAIEPPAAEEREAEAPQGGARRERARADDVTAAPVPAEAAAPTVVTNETAGAGAAASAQDLVSDDAAPAPQVADAVAPVQESRAALARQAAPAAPAPTGQVLVRGTVRDERGDPVPSAQVYVADLNVGVLSRQDGSYELRLPARDSLDLVVERIGYRRESQEISGSSGAPIVADFQMKQEALQLQEVIVTGTVGATQRRALGNSVTRLTAVPEWGPSTREAAEAVLDHGLITLPEARIISIDVADELVRVRQDVGDAVVLTLVQGRGGEGVDAWPVESAGAVASRQIGDLLVTATAPLTTDSLRALLATVR